MKLFNVSAVLTLSTAACLAACATDESKVPVGDDAVAAIDVDEAKDDSLSRPTRMGEIAMGADAAGSLTRRVAFHAYDFTYAGTSGQVRLDVIGERRTDAAVVAYKKNGRRWSRIGFNDDCDAGTRDACLTFDAGAGDYRFVVTTYDALIRRPGAASYLFGVSCDGGDCEPPADVSCGGRGGHACADGQFCSFPIENACGSFDGPGVCTAMPDACIALYQPVCGCDGHSYGNACDAASSGVSIVAEGECAAESVPCGGRLGNTCGADQFCQFDRGAVCGFADATGTCAPRDGGECPVNIQAVCGCDGITYASDCEAGKAGTGVLHDGRCTTPPSE